MSSRVYVRENDLVQLKEDPETFVHKGQEFKEARVLKPCWHEKKKKQQERKDKATVKKIKTQAKKEMKKGKQTSIKLFFS